MNIKLSEREKEVLNLLSLGYTNNEIGLKLYMSHHTVNTHRKKLIKKLDSKNTPHLIRQAIKLQFIKI